MENAKIVMLGSAKLVKEDDIIESVLEHGIKESACSLKLEQCDVIKCISIYVNRMRNRIADLEERVFYESLPKNANCAYVKRIMVDEVEKIVVTEKEKSESESSKNSDKESTSIKKEDKEKSGSESSKNSDKESTSIEKEDKKESETESNKNSGEESTSAEKEDKKESETESSKNSDEESTSVEKEEEEGGLESSMVSVEKSTSTDQEKTLANSSGVVSLAQIMMEQAMSTEENESYLKTSTEKDKGVAASKQMVGRGFGRGSVFARDCVQGGFGRGHYVRRQQQQQNLVTKEDTSSSDNPVHGGLSMYMENARIIRTRKQKR